jgi:hypothetical protein
MDKINELMRIAEEKIGIILAKRLFCVLLPGQQVFTAFTGPGLKDRFRHGPRPSPNISELCKRTTEFSPVKSQ